MRSPRNPNLVGVMSHSKFSPFASAVMNAAMQAAVGAFWLDAVRSAGEIGKKDIQRVHDKQFSAGLLGKLRPKQLHDCALDALRRDHCVSELASIEYFLWQGQDAAEPQLRRAGGHGLEREQEREQVR